MASEIHKKRTGKGFKISEAIVMREEMYEEEEDELPRQFRNLTTHLSSQSPLLANRLNDYVSTQVAMHSLAARELEVDKQFAEQFPHYQAAVSQFPARSSYLPPYAAGLPGPTNPSPSAFSQHHRHSMDAAMGQSPSPAARPASMHGDMPARSLSLDLGLDSPGSDQTPLAQGPQDQYFAANNNTMAFPAPTSAALSSTNYFTAELPNDVKQLASLDWNDAMTPALYGGQGGLMDLDGNAGASLDWVNLMGPEVTTAGYGSSVPSKAPPAPALGDYFDGIAHPISQRLELPGGQSTIGTPGGGAGGDPWDVWIDIDSYGPDGADKP